MKIRLNEANQITRPGKAFDISGTEIPGAYYQDGTQAMVGDCVYSHEDDEYYVISCYTIFGGACCVELLDGQMRRVAQLSVQINSPMWKRLRF